jgi:hypothetical protein
VQDAVLEKLPARVEPLDLGLGGSGADPHLAQVDLEVGGDTQSFMPGDALTLSAARPRTGGSARPACTRNRGARSRRAPR